MSKTSLPEFLHILDIYFFFVDVMGMGITFCVSVKMEAKEALGMCHPHDNGPALCMQYKIMDMGFCCDFYNAVTERADKWTDLYSGENKYLIHCRFSGFPTYKACRGL